MLRYFKPLDPNKIPTPPKASKTERVKGLAKKKSKRTPSSSTSNKRKRKSDSAEKKRKTPSPKNGAKVSRNQKKTNSSNKKQGQITSPLFKKFKINKDEDKQLNETLDQNMPSSPPPTGPSPLVFKSVTPVTSPTKKPTKQQQANSLVKQNPNLTISNSSTDANASAPITPSSDLKLDFLSSCPASPSEGSQHSVDQKEAQPAIETEKSLELKKEKKKPTTVQHVFFDHVNKQNKQEELNKNSKNLSLIKCLKKQKEQEHERPSYLNNTADHIAMNIFDLNSDLNLNTSANILTTMIRDRYISPAAKLKIQKVLLSIFQKEVYIYVHIYTYIYISLAPLSLSLSRPAPNYV